MKKPLKISIIIAAVIAALLVGRRFLFVIVSPIIILVFTDFSV